MTARAVDASKVPNQQPVSTIRVAALARPGIGTQKPRLIGIDVTRGLALLGMMAVHALFLYDESYNPTWVTTVALGNASATFAVLAGVGLSLTTGRAKVPMTKARSTAAAVAGRAAAVGAIGLALGYADAEVTGVILPYYAVLFLLAIPLLLLRTRWVVLIGLVTAIVVPALSSLVRPHLPLPSLENLSVASVFDDPWGSVGELLLTGAYPALPWMTYICAGLVVGRMTLSAVRTARRLLVWGVLLAIGCRAAASLLLGPLGGRTALQLAGLGDTGAAEAQSVDEVLVFGFDGTTPTTSWWWLATHGPHGGTPLDLLGSTGVALAVLGAMLLLGHAARPAVARAIAVLTAPLAAAGAMTLTLYAAHITFMNSDLDVFGATDGYVIQVMVGLLFALGWRQAVGRGPLETLVTAVSNRARALVPSGPGPDTSAPAAGSAIAPTHAISPRASARSAGRSATTPKSGANADPPPPTETGVSTVIISGANARPLSERIPPGRRSRHGRLRMVPVDGRERQVSTPHQDGDSTKDLTSGAEPAPAERASAEPATAGLGTAGEATPAPKHLRVAGSVPTVDADDSTARHGDQVNDDGPGLEQLGITVQRSAEGGRHRR